MLDLAERKVSCEVNIRLAEGLQNKNEVNK